MKYELVLTHRMYNIVIIRCSRFIVCIFPFITYSLLIFSRSGPRSDGSSSGECDVPLVFANAVHIAIDCGAADVLRLLLRYGVPPDRPGIPGASTASTAQSTSKSAKPSPRVSPTGHNVDKRSSLTAGYSTSPRLSPKTSPKGSPRCSPRSGSPRSISPLTGGDRIPGQTHDPDKRLRPMLVRQVGSEMLDDRTRKKDMKLNLRHDEGYANRQQSIIRTHGKTSPSEGVSRDLRPEFEERKLRYRQEEELRRKQAPVANYDEEIKKRETANEKLRRDIEEAMRIRDMDEKQRLKDEEERKARRALEEENKDKFDKECEELESIPEMNHKTIPEDPSLEDEETGQEKREGDDKKTVSRRVSWVPEVAEKTAGPGSREKPAYKRRHSAIVRRAVVTFQRQRSFSLDSQQVA